MFTTSLKCLFVCVVAVWLVTASGCLFPVEEQPAKKERDSDLQRKQPTEESKQKEEQQDDKRKNKDPEEKSETPPPSEKKSTEEKKANENGHQGEGQSKGEKSPKGGEGQGNPSDSKGTNNPSGSGGGAPGDSREAPGRRSGEGLNPTVPRRPDGVPATPQSKGSRLPAAKDAEAARSNAGKLLAEAEKEFRDGDSAGAYGKAIEAWEQANAFAGSDPDCRKLADAILERLKQFGEEANRSTGKVSPSTPLVTE